MARTPLRLVLAQLVILDLAHSLRTRANVFPSDGNGSLGDAISCLMIVRYIVSPYDMPKHILLGGVAK
jgi:hypothetical protein